MRKIQCDGQLYEEFQKCVDTMIRSQPILKMKGFVHHKNTTCMDHSIYVAYVSFCISRRFGLDYVSTARGALLHDLFLYNWRETKKGQGREGMHGFTHPRAAFNNACKYFSINEKEKDIIIKHMWPLTIIPPKCLEALVVSLADKYCSIMELSKIANKTSRRLRELYAIN